LAGNNVYSSDINDYQILQINPNLETFFELTLKINVGALSPPSSFSVPIYFVIFDGVNVLQNQIISNLSYPNTILNFTTKANFELITKKETLYYGIFLDTNLTTAQKNWVNANLTLDWSLIVNQNQII
jgi:hypothetical protein